MARNFNASGVYASGTSAVTSGNCTFSAWVKPNDSTSNIEALTLCDSITSANNYFRLVPGVSTFYRAIFQSKVGSFLTVLGGTTLSSGVWYHIAVTIVAAGTATIYLNGVSDGSGSVGAPSNMTNSLIGKFAGGAQYSNGVVADAAYWNVLLTAGEIAALAKGVRPYLIRPASLKGYFPLDGIASPEPDFSGLANNLTLTGSPPAANGPPTTLFTPKIPTFFSAAAGTVLTLATAAWNWATQPPTVLTATTLSLSSKSWPWTKQSPTLQFANALTTKAWNWTKQSIAANTVNVLASKAWNWIGVAFTLVGGATVLTLATATWNWANQAIIATGGGIAAGGIAAKEWIIRRRRRS